MIAVDLDGTLIDARAPQVGVATETLAELTGLVLDDIRFWRAKRRGATTLQALEQLGHPPAIAIAVSQRWTERIESEEWLCRDRALPRSAETLADLRRVGVAIAVLTARRRSDGARLSLSSAGLEEHIDHLFVADPAGVVAAKAKELRRCRAAAFVGDTESDGAAARRAGVPFGAVATGQRSRSYLCAQGYEPASSLHAAVGSLLSVSAGPGRI